MDSNIYLNNNRKPKFLETIKGKASIAGAYLAAGYSRMLAVPTSSTDLGTKVQDTTNSIVTEIAAIYCNSVVWLLLVIEVATLLFSKNDKALGFAKKGLFGTVILYVVLVAVTGSNGVLSGFMDNIASWMGA